MSQDVLKTRRLILVDELQGSSKYYDIDLSETRGNLFASHVVTIRRGRIGQNPETIDRRFENLDRAEEYFSRKIAQKLRSGYTDRQFESYFHVPSCSLCRLIEKAREDDCYIMELEHTMVFLNWDQTYRGRSMLVLKTHVLDFFKLHMNEILGIVREVRLVQAALEETLRPDRFNHLFMGNTAGHAHLHIVPRYQRERNFGASPFLDTDRATSPQLPGTEYRKLAARIALVLMDAVAESARSSG